MPFTPFHWGLTLLVVVLFPLDFVSLFITSVVQDIEPFLILFIFQDSSLPLHGAFHSLTLAIPIGVLIGLSVNFCYNLIRRYWKYEKIQKFSSFSLKNSVISGLIGTISHTLLDALIYQDLPLVWPLKGNILYTGSHIVSYYICIVAFIFAVFIGFIKLTLKWRTKN